MKYSEITNKSNEELMAILSELRVQFAQLQFDRGDKKLKDFSQFKKNKKDIARVLTELNRQHTTNNQQQKSEKVTGINL